MVIRDILTYSLTLCIRINEHKLVSFCLTTRIVCFILSTNEFRPMRESHFKSYVQYNKM